MWAVIHWCHPILATIFLAYFGVSSHAIVPKGPFKETGPRYTESFRIGDRCIAGALLLSPNPNDVVSTPSMHAKKGEEKRDYGDISEYSDLEQPRATPAEDPEEILVMHVAVVDLEEEFIVPISATHDGILFLGSATITSVVPTTITTYGTLDEDGNLYFATPTLKQTLTAESPRPTDMELASGYREQTVEVPDGYFTYDDVVYGFEPFEAYVYVPDEESYTLEVNGNVAVHVSQSQTISGGKPVDHNTDNTNHEQTDDQTDDGEPEDDKDETGDDGDLTITPGADGTEIDLKSLSYPFMNQPLWQQAMLEMHTSYRARHDAPKVIWNPDLVIEAKKRLDSNVFGHVADNPYGENLASGTYSNPLYYGFKLYDELQIYDYDNPDFQKEAGHFTQLVWTDSIEIGCAYTNEAKLASGWSHYLACEYKPPGNYLGQFKEKVLPANDLPYPKTPNQSI